MNNGELLISRFNCVMLLVYIMFKCYYVLYVFAYWLVVFVFWRQISEYEVVFPWCLFIFPCMKYWYACYYQQFVLIVQFICYLLLFHECLSHDGISKVLMSSGDWYHTHIVRKYYEGIVDSNDMYCWLSLISMLVTLIDNLLDRLCKFLFWYVWCVHTPQDGECYTRCVSLWYCVLCFRSTAIFYEILGQ